MIKSQPIGWDLIHLIAGQGWPVLPVDCGTSVRSCLLLVAQHSFLTSFLHYGQPKNFNTFCKTADLRVALSLSPTKNLMNVMKGRDCSLDQGVKTNFIAIYHVRFRGLARQRALSTFGAVQFTVKQASNNDGKEKNNRRKNLLEFIMESYGTWNKLIYLSSNLWPEYQTLANLIFTLFKPLLVQHGAHIYIFIVGLFCCTVHEQQ